MRRASETARGSEKKMFPVTRQEKIEGDAAWNKCTANGNGKNAKKKIGREKRMVQRGASKSRSGERFEPKLRQGCSVAARKKRSLGIAETATAKNVERGKRSGSRQTTE